MSLINAFLLLAGSLGFLLYGMRLMSDGVQKSAGERLQRALCMITGNKIAALLTGLGVTVIIQSSGATTVMVISFINAGLLTLSQSVGVTFQSQHLFSKKFELIIFPMAFPNFSCALADKCKESTGDDSTTVPAFKNKHPHSFATFS